jgi:hypothetical protein
MHKSYTAYDIRITQWRHAARIRTNPIEGIWKPPSTEALSNLCRASAGGQILQLPVFFTRKMDCSAGVWLSAVSPVWEPHENA